MNDAYLESSKTLRCGLILYSAQEQAMEKILTNLMEKIPSQFILLCDSSGMVVTSCGQIEKSDPVALGALVAGDLAASQEMARLTGEFQSHQMILREGGQTNTWIIDAGPHLILMFKVSSNIPLGWTRLVIRRAAELIAQIVETNNDESAATDLDINNDDFSEQISKSLDELWQF